MIQITMDNISRNLLMEALVILEDLIADENDDRRYEQLKNRRDQIKALNRIQDTDIQQPGGFLPVLNNRYQCPACWAREGVLSSLNNLPASADKYCFICKNCFSEFDYSSVEEE